MILISTTVNDLTNFSYFFGQTVNKTISADVCYISKSRLYKLFDNIFPLGYLFFMVSAHQNFKQKSSLLLLVFSSPFNDCGIYKINLTKMIEMLELKKCCKIWGFSKFSPINLITLDFGIFEYVIQRKKYWIMKQVLYFVGLTLW